MDVLCVGHASYDLTFTVPRHPASDEKLFADGFLTCGGGPAANAAVMVARLGLQAGFAGYLGRDLYGDRHCAEFGELGIATDLVVRGEHPTPVSVVLVKPDGQRSLVNYKGSTHALAAGTIDAEGVSARVMLFDGHEPVISIPLVEKARACGIATVLDAGSLHDGTRSLMQRVDYMVCSEKFAAQWLGRNDPEEAIGRLAPLAPAVVITLGEEGVLWQKGAERGRVPAFPVTAVDTTGAGDVFHGAFAAGVAAGLGWDALLELASAAGALCCTRLGARTGIPGLADIAGLLGRNPFLQS